MNRHSWRVRDRQAGLSFMELLVTIIIAGIAFAALVPVFVNAQQASSKEKMRNVAINVAQSRLEKIRDLDYEQVSSSSPDDNLNSATFKEGQFKPNAEPELGEGNPGTRYTVTTVATDPGSAYKLVQVTVTWNHLGGAPGTVTLKTYIYRGVGPHINNMAFDPLPLYPGSEEDPWLTSTTELVLVSIDPTDVSAMQPTNSFPEGGRVEVTATSQSGRVYPIGKLYAKDNLNNSLYSIEWSGASATDDMYSVRAVAFSPSGFQGNVYETSVRLETDRPDPPVMNDPTVGTTSVGLTWTASPSKDVVRYVLQRSGGTGGDVTLSTDPAVTPLFTATAFSDTGLITGTEYTYTLWAVDAVGNESVHVTRTAIPEVTAGIGLQPPENLVAACTGNTVQLTWTAPFAGPTPDGYRVYLQGATLSPYETVTSLVANYTLQYDTPYTFSVAAWLGGEESSRVTVSIGTQVEVRYTLTITNNLPSNKTAEYIALDLWDPALQTWALNVKPQQNTIVATASAIFSDLPAGSYRYRWPSSGNAADQSRETTLLGLNPIVGVTLH